MRTIFSIKNGLIAISLAFIVIMLILPLVIIFNEALKGGFTAYTNVLRNSFTLKALSLSLLATFIAVFCNTVFGLFTAWALTRFTHRYNKFVTTLIDIPFGISPVIAGLIFSLTYGRSGWLNPLLKLIHIKIIFTVTAIILVTIFVTLPFIARSIIPVLQARGTQEEEAAALMGASGFTIFYHITLPHIRWTLFYGIILCTARAMGEFGAVSVISGHLYGKTDTLPLLIESLYNDFKMTDAFAVSTILVTFAIILLILKNFVQYKYQRARE